MSKHLLFAAAFAALITCACSVNPVDVQPEEDGEITVLTAGFAGAEDETRTVRQTDGKVFWSPGDAISVIRGTSAAGHKKFVSGNTEPAASATFTGTMPSGASAYWAVYPYKEDDFYNGSYLVTKRNGWITPNLVTTLSCSDAEAQILSASHHGRKEQSV